MFESRRGAATLRARGSEKKAQTPREGTIQNAHAQYLLPAEGSRHVRKKTAKLSFVNVRLIY